MREQVGSFPQPKYAFLDIETTGLDPVKNEPLEIAYILMPHRHEHSFTIVPQPERVGPVAMRVNGWGKRAFAPTVSPDMACGLILEHLTRRIVIGNNVQFDLSFLSHLLRRRGYNPIPWHYNPVDLKAMWGGMVGEAPPWDTSKIEDDLDIERRDLEAPEHTALGDARWNFAVYNAIMRHHKNFPPQ
jgi:DNA polymerase III epsilon subunit-like protein